MNESEASERDIALATFREIQAVKRILATFLVMVLIVLAGAVITTCQTVLERDRAASRSVVTVAR